MNMPRNAAPPLFAVRHEHSTSSLEYDEDGSLSLARALFRLDGGATSPALPTATSTHDGMAADELDGSWYLELFGADGTHPLIIRGAVRIEVTPPKLRISGDVYTERASGPTGSALESMLRDAARFGDNWYPHLPRDQYSWYFRSVSAKYARGTLVFKFERHLWNRTTQEFIGKENSGKDTGFMEFAFDRSLPLSHPWLPQPTRQVEGIAQVGGETYTAVLTKTSPYYRGCGVEVDVMAQRAFPMDVTTAAGVRIDFAAVYRTAGMDCQITIGDRDLRDDDRLTVAELQDALARNRREAAGSDAWRLWMLIGSSQGSLYGVMFDDAEPYREGVCGFYDARLPDEPTIAQGVRRKKLGEVPAAFLRTLVHEAGHAFNLYHPKHDVHSVAPGTTIMNQTGDVMEFATGDTLYPDNIGFFFDAHNRTSLIHSPDPQVAPGWKRFGWGHGSLSGGIAEPVDAGGFLHGVASSTDLALEIALPDVVYLGEFVHARFVLTNTGIAARTVTAELNLAGGDLRLLLKPPHEEPSDVRDLIIACGDRALTTLQPGQSLQGVAQVFYTNVGFTFRQSGRYQISVEFDPGGDAGEMVRSTVRTVVVRAPATAEEEEISRLSLFPGVGRAFAFGDFGVDEEALLRLATMAEKYPASANGRAAALTLSNAFGRDLRDLKAGGVARSADPARAASHFDHSLLEGGLDPAGLASLALAVVAPT